MENEIIRQEIIRHLNLFDNISKVGQNVHGNTEFIDNDVLTDREVLPCTVIEEEKGFSKDDLFDSFENSIEEGKRRVIIICIRRDNNGKEEEQTKSIYTKLAKEDNLPCTVIEEDKVISNDGRFDFIENTIEYSNKKTIIVCSYCRKVKKKALRKLTNKNLANYVEITGSSPTSDFVSNIWLNPYKKELMVKYGNSIKKVPENKKKRITINADCKDTLEHVNYLKLSEYNIKYFNNEKALCKLQHECISKFGLKKYFTYHLKENIVQMNSHFQVNEMAVLVSNNKYLSYVSSGLIDTNSEIKLRKKEHPKKLLFIYTKKIIQ
ncbi:hypothetical protein FACS1894145_2630 [Bacteroidia bacterium]|nr:hypothetical protein FACS1894145_2630 [Bacteroidia bacterium]